MTILAWCLIAVGCYIALVGLRKRRTDKFIATLPPNIQAEIEEVVGGQIREDKIEDAIRQVLAKHKAEREKTQPIILSPTQREAALKQIVAKYRAEGLKIRQEAIRQGLGPDALPPLDEWPFKKG